ncbi:MAG: host-nuclease inhibitor Gam family protein [Mitsuokella sp.]
MSAEMEKKPFEVTDEASAEWVLEKLEENAKARALIDEQYQRMIARHEAWRADALKELDENDAYLQSLLRPWAEAKLAGGKKKSVKLPSGRVGFRAGGETWKMGAEKVEATNPALLAFVKENDDSFVKVQESVRWGDYKKTLNVVEDGRVATADGQIIEGMTVTKGKPSFYVEVTK